MQIGGRGVPGLPSPDEERDGKKPTTPTTTLETKATNDAVALIRSLAELRGRNAEWAEKAVREAATLNARQALQEHVIDLVAADVEDLLRAVNGRKIVIANDKERTLSTLGVAVERIEPDFMTKALGTFAPTPTLPSF